VIPRRRLLARLALALLALCAFEGLCSLGLLAYDAAFHSRRPLAERSHTRYDAGLGWVAIESASFPDLYGPGRSMHTNARGFRGRAEVAERVPPDKVRVVFAGDSFTLGYGVDDEDAWPRVIERIDPRVEALNLGQGGYGIDQAWLWYRRTAEGLEHDVLVFAFIAEDFERMRESTFMAYGKPYLELEGGALVERNVPVPKAGYRFPWLAHNRALFNRLGSVALVRRMLGETSRRRQAQDEPALDEPAARAVAEAVFDALAAGARTSGRSLALVHLPSVDPHLAGRVLPLAGWAAAACRGAGERGMRFIDLAPRLEMLPREERSGLFLDESQVDFPDAAGHYSERGNEWIARALLEELAPEIDAAAARSR